MPNTTVKHPSNPHPPEHKSSHKFLHIARRFYPRVVTFRRYITELNDQASHSGHQISLQPSHRCPATSFHRLLDQLYVAWLSQPPHFPELVSGALKARGAVSMDQLLQDVISTTLRRHPTPFAAHQCNVLCSGFSLASDYGCGSMFRNLDAHSSSSPVQLLRAPLWREILSCVGCVVLRYLLMNNVLLLSVSESRSAEREGTALKSPRRLSSVFLQLCGPTTYECFKPDVTTPTAVGRKILIKRDVIHSDSPCRSSLIRTGKRNDLRPSSPPLQSHRNNGLPKSHHLQNLRVNDAASKQLLAIIFDANCNDHALPAGNSRATNGQSNLNQSNQQTPHVSGRNLPWQSAPDFELRAEQLASLSKIQKRGRSWMRHRRRSYSRLRQLVPILEKVICRTNKFSFRRILGLTCPLSNSFRRDTEAGLGSTEQMIKMDSNPKDVARFLVACTRQMFPTAVFGSSRNRDIFEKGIHMLIRRRFKRERFDILLFTQQSGFRVKDFSWLHRPGNGGDKICNPTDLKFRRSRIYELFVWLFWGVVLPIIQQSFYVTDSDLHRNRVFFYRREVWTRLIDNAHNSVLRQNKKFRVLSREELSKYTAKREENMALLGKGICPYPVLLYNKIRFVPKRSSLRGIQRISGKMLNGFCSAERRYSTRQDLGSRKGSRKVSKARSCIRRAFRCILRVLAMESSKDNTTMGASVFSLNDIYDRFLRLRTAWHEKGRPKMYACSVDISTSFDTIPHGALLHDVIPKLLSKERYAFFRYALSKPSLSTRKINQRYLVHSCQEPGEEASFLRLVRDRLCPQHPGAVFTDLAQVDTLTHDQILLVLKEFLLGRNLVSVPGRNRRGSETGFAIQCQGVPQGSELSPLLTSLFYAHVENEDLAEFLLCAPQGDTCRRRVGASSHSTSDAEVNLFMRLVDDSIFFTSSASKADGFAKRTRKGWEATHGFTVNVDKTKCNFPTAFTSICMRRLPWCGLILDTALLEVTADFTRYGQKDGGSLRDALSIVGDERPGQYIAERALTCFKPKLHPLLLDSNINSRSTTALNVYQAALLVCLKLGSCAVVTLPRDTYLTWLVEISLSMFIRLVARTVASRHAKSRACRFSLTHNEVCYLVIHAFHSGINRKLKPKRQMAKRVRHCIGSIDRKLKKCKSRLTNQEASIQLAAKRISENSCGTFWDMKL